MAPAQRSGRLQRRSQPVENALALESVHRIELCPRRTALAHEVGVILAGEFQLAEISRRLGDVKFEF